MLEARGATVEVSSRRYGQTVELLGRHGIDAVLLGEHGGATRLGKVRALVDRLPALIRFGRERHFDIALTHGSHELTLAARLLGIPSSTTFDYEFAALQHHLGCRAATRVVVPDTIPRERLRRYGVRPPRLLAYPGLKEEYYLSDFEPDEGALDELAIDRDRVFVVVRPPADVAAYHLGIANEIFPLVLDRLGRDEVVSAVVIPRTDEQRQSIAALSLPSVVVAPGAVDAQSLIGLADLVVSAGGTMNREAVALGVPVYTIFSGRLGGVDEALLRQGRLLPLTDASALRVGKRVSTAERIRRDPERLLELLLSPLVPRARGA
jgi:uncharacterized protein